MKRIYNNEKKTTIWRGEEYLVDGVPALVKPPLFLLNEVVYEVPYYDNTTHRLVNIPPYPNVESGEWVVRSYEIKALTAEEIAQNQVLAMRKVWITVSDFWSEFSNEEKYAIEVSQDPTLIVLRADLKLWLKDVWSDDPRIQFAMGKLVELGILSEERRTQILAKTS